jgi:hypothetical protein
MAIELKTCKACGTKNASHRSVCLKCGVRLSVQESPGKNDDLGSIVSRFVEGRADGPQPAEIDLWCEAVYASLFSVAFEVVIRLSSEKGSPDALERETKTIIDTTCGHAAPWVNARLAEHTRRSVGVSVQWDLAPEMRNRMLQYFNVAYGAISNRGYEPQVARSHACFVVLKAVLTPLCALLAQQGAMGLDEASVALMKIFDGCEEMSREIGQTLDRYRR